MGGMTSTYDQQSNLLNHQSVEKSSTDAIREKASIILPKLPVPDLHVTLQQYLLFVKSLVSEKQFEATRAIVEEFGERNGIGEKIQKKLIQRSKKLENWAGKWWLNDMYLNNRAPLPVNSNPGLVLPRKNFKTEASKLRYAAKLTAGIIEFKAVLDARALPIDVARGQLAGQPMCMDQYYRLLNSYRIPGRATDELVSFKTPTDEPQHIVVACNNQFFAVDISLGGSYLSEDDFLRQFERIQEATNDVSYLPSEPVGILTSLNRSEWAEARGILMAEKLNQQSLDALERCIFVLCLDRTADADNDKTMAHQLLHGSGVEFNSSNRWYDKTVQLIISSDGVHGLSYEHSASEGIAVITLIEHLLKYISVQESKGLSHSSTVKDLPIPERLRWNVNGRVSELIKLALKEARKTAENLDLEIFRFKDYGKEFIKRQSLSPDAFIQVALQVTYFNLWEKFSRLIQVYFNNLWSQPYLGAGLHLKLYKRLVSTYESASTRRFREGRVDNIRAATLQALDFAKRLSEQGLGESLRNDPHKMQLLLKAIKAQTDFTISAITGYGIDCHLLGLKMMAQEMGLEIPKLFTDPSYDLSNYFQLSTSQIPTTTDSFMCYGPVVPDGYGVSYNPHKDSIVFCISSFRTCLSTNSDKFAVALKETLLAMKAICQEWNNRRSASSERIDNSSKVSLHRRMRGCALSGEETPLRFEHGNKRLLERGVGKDKIIRKVNGRDRTFARQRSLNFIQLNRQACRESAKSEQVPSPQNLKLSRRYSDVTCKVDRMTSLRSCLSSDLMEVLKRENAEFI